MNDSLKGITLREEFDRNPECSKESFHELKIWLEEQEHLPKISGTCFGKLLYNFQ